MDFDPKKIKLERRIIDGKEIIVQIAPPGMHGPGYRPDLFRIGPIIPEDNDHHDEDDHGIKYDPNCDGDEGITTEDLISAYERVQERD